MNRDAMLASLFVLAAFFGIGTGWLAARKNRNYWLWGFLGAVLLPIAGILLACLRSLCPDCGQPLTKLQWRGRQCPDCGDIVGPPTGYDDPGLHQLATSQEEFRTSLDLGVLAFLLLLPGLLLLALRHHLGDLVGAGDAGRGSLFVATWVLLGVVALLTYFAVDATYASFGRQRVALNRLCAATTAIFLLGLCTYIFLQPLWDSLLTDFASWLRDIA